MFRRIFLAAALAGVIAGAFATALQLGFVVPLILEAETYETAAPAAHGHGDSESDIAAHDHGTIAAGGEEWAPADGWERNLYTLAFNILMCVGAGLLLVAGLSVTGESGWRKGVYWGAAGFIAVILAPALGLPPEIPGAEAAPLVDRQLWWIGTVAATAGGLALIFLTRGWQWVVVGAALIALPHVIGAPQPAEHGGLAPEALARQFVIAVLVTGFLFWLALGALAGFFHKRFAGS